MKKCITDHYNFLFLSNTKSVRVIIIIILPIPHPHTAFSQIFSPLIHGHKFSFFTTILHYEPFYIGKAPHICAISTTLKYTSYTEYFLFSFTHFACPSIFFLLYYTHSIAPLLSLHPFTAHCLTNNNAYSIFLIWSVSKLEIFLISMVQYMLMSP